MSSPTFNSFRKNPLVVRLVVCLAGGVVLALMWGSQEGSTTDSAHAFTEAVLAPRIVGFLALGVLVWALISFWPRVRPYVVRPGAWPLVSGVVTVGAALFLMHWDDQVGNAKFSAVSSAVADTSGLAPLVTIYFGWLYWVGLLIVALLSAATIVTRRSLLGWIAAALSVVMGVLGLIAHSTLLDFTGGIDHSTGPFVALAGYVVIAAAAIAAGTSPEQVAQSRAFMAGLFGWRPGLPLVVVGALATIWALASATWFSPQNSNLTLSDTRTTFEGTGLSSLAVQYLAWLGWVSLAAAAVLTGAASYLRHRLLGWIGALVGAVGVVLTLITLYDISDLGAQNKFNSATGPWQNLGIGGWLACLGLFLIGSGGVIAAITPKSASGGATAEPIRSVLVPSRLRAAGDTLTQYRSLALAGAALVLFYPPMATLFWQKVLVIEVGVYVLLAIGLNVVVGWAGLLDLGFIAFFAIGSYTTAFLVGALPRKPPSWLHLSPLLAIPFAIIFCLIAGVLLGAPTLRLRGDYLAIVTLGFGEIIRIIAINNPGNFTNGPRGATNIPHPVIHLGPIHVTWGLDSLPYWYLLVVIIGIVLLLFYRLENSRLGRAWAAVREDEVAAQATGINATKVKLLAFAIGASTSGVAGVFFATQVGYINPDNFVLNNSILVLAYVVFGGMGSLPGAMAGAAVLTWLPEFLKDQVPSDDRVMWIGAIVLLMMILRPAGLIPAKRRKAELSGLQGTSSAETTAVPASEGL